MNYKIIEEKVLFTPMGTEGVLFGIETGEYLSLNETFVHIFSGIQIGSNQEEIVQNLLSMYNIDELSCRKAVEISIQQLLEKGFIIQC